MNAFFQFLTATLEPLEATVLALATAISLGWLGWYLWRCIHHYLAFYLHSPNLTEDELELMQLSEASDEKSRQVARNKLEELEPAKQQALADGFALHNQVTRLSHHQFQLIYKKLIQRTLCRLSLWFNERQLQPKLHAMDVTQDLAAPQINPAFKSNRQSYTIHWKRWFSLQSYLLLLLMAFTYPFLLALLNSYATNTIGLAGVNLQYFNDAMPMLWFAILLVISAFFAMKWMNNLYGQASFFATWIWLGAFVAINFLITIPVYGDVAFAITMAALVIVAFAVTITVGFTGSGTFAFAFAHLLKHIELKSKYRVPLSIMAINTALLSYYIFMLFTLKEYGEDDKQHMLLLPVFLGILPLSNGLFDWLSFNITRLFAYKMLQKQRSALANLGLGSLIVSLAILFSLLATATILIVLTGVNHLYHTSIVDLSLFMTHLGNPAHNEQYYWMVAMLLTTLIPSVIHLLLIGFCGLITGIMRWKRNTIETLLTKSLSVQNPVSQASVAPTPVEQTPVEQTPAAQTLLEHSQSRKNLLLYVQLRRGLLVLSSVILLAVLYALAGQTSGLLCHWWQYADSIAQLADNLFGNLSGEQWYKPATSVCKV